MDITIVPLGEYSRELLKVATMDDLYEIKEITGDFTDNHEERIKAGKLYVLRENSEFLGLGIIEDNVIMKNYKGMGMFTNEKQRQNGVGRSIILHLKDICHENDGSLLVTIVTDTPLVSSQCKRISKRAALAMAKLGGIREEGNCMKLPIYYYVGVRAA